MESTSDSALSGPESLEESDASGENSVANAISRLDEDLKDLPTPNPLKWTVSRISNFPETVALLSGNLVKLNFRFSPGKRRVRVHKETARLRRLRRGLPHPGNRRPGSSAAEGGPPDVSNVDEIGARVENLRQNRHAPKHRGRRSRRTSAARSV